MTKTLTITQLIEHFKLRDKFLKTPAKRAELEKVLQFIQKDDYNQLLFDFGELYCLVVLDLFEQSEDYLVCAEILRQIETHNVVTGSTFKTSLWHL